MLLSSSYGLFHTALLLGVVLFDLLFGLVDGSFSRVGFGCDVIIIIDRNLGSLPGGLGGDLFVVDGGVFVTFLLGGRLLGGLLGLLGLLGGGIGLVLVFGFNFWEGGAILAS